MADGAARELMLVLHDAIDTRVARVVEASLDCLQKLVSFSLIRGEVFAINQKKSSGSSGSSSSSTSFFSSDVDSKAGTCLQFAAQPPHAQAVELVCACADTGDDAVDLRLLRALLTIITASTLQVHSTALLLCVRSTYNVFLTSKSEVTQATAKATLMQIVNAVFFRIETGCFAVSLPPVTIDEVMRMGGGVGGDEDGKRHEASSTASSVYEFLSGVAAAVDPFGTAARQMEADLDAAFVVSKRVTTDDGGTGVGGELSLSLDLPSSPLHSIMSADEKLRAMSLDGKATATTIVGSGASDVGRRHEGRSGEGRVPVAAGAVQAID